VGPATSQHTCQCGINNNCFDRTLKCNADSLAPLGLADGYETRYGFVDVKSNPVHFFVVRQSSWSTLNVPMKFDVEKLNLGGGMNIGSG